MTTFQKLLLASIVLFGFSSLFLFNRFLDRQEQIREEDLTAKEQQRQIADCKYLLNNKDLILERENNVLNEFEIAVKLGYLTEEDLREQRKKLSPIFTEYNKSAQTCRDLLRQLGQE